MSLALLCVPSSSPCAGRRPRAPMAQESWRLEGHLGTQVPAASGHLPWLSVDSDQLLSPA